MVHQTWSTQPPAGPSAPQYGPPPTGPAQPPAQRRRTGAIVGAVVAAVVLLGGLAVAALVLFGATTLDTAEAERRIAQLTEDQAGVEPTDVACPADVEVESGSRFSCSASLEGQPISFTVTQADDEGNVLIDSDETFVDVAIVEESLDEQVARAAGVPVVSTCDAGGRSVLVDGIGQPIPCTVANAEDPSDSIEVSATVDESGAVSYEVV